MRNIFLPTINLVLMVAVAGCRDDAERKRGGFESRTKPGPRKAGVALVGSPRLEVVGRHRAIEAGQLSRFNKA